MKKLFSLNSVLIGLALMAYFIIIDQAGLADQIELKLVNALIVGVGLWMVLYKRSDEGEEFGLSYFKGFRKGMAVTFGAAITFAAGFLLYTSFIDGSVIELLHQNTAVPAIIGKWHLSAMIVFEVLAVGLVFTLLLMQYLKHDKSSDMNLQVDS